MSDIQEQNIDQLLENVGSKKLEWEAFFEIKVTKKNVVLYAIVLLLSIFLAYLFAFDINTKEKFIMVVEKFIEVELWSFFSNITIHNKRYERMIR